MSEWMTAFCRSWSGKRQIPWTGWQEVQEVRQQEAVLWSWAPVGRKVVLISALALCSWQSLCLICEVFRAVPAISLDSCTHSSRYHHGCSLVIKEKQKKNQDPDTWEQGSTFIWIVSCSRESPGTMGICFLEDLKYTFIDYSNFEIMMGQSSKAIGKVLSPHLTAVFIAASYESK